LSAHTPGPWWTRAGSWNAYGKVSAKGGAVALLEPRTRTPDDPEMEANARLIAAAPDLLRCLRAFVENPASWQIDAGHVKRALRVIAKVEGDS